MRIGQKTNLCTFPDSVSISDRGDLEIEAINLNGLLNIIPDDRRFESIHLGIILEYVGEETDVLEARLSHRRLHIKEDNIHHQ